jgi:NADPH2:quinone reductase
VNYRDQDAAAAIREIAPDGVDLIVEVSPAGNNEVDLAVARNGATIAIYAADGGDTFPVPVRRTFTLNLRYQFLLLYTLDPGHLAAAVQDVTAAISAGAPSRRARRDRQGPHRHRLNHRQAGRVARAS